MDGVKSSKSWYIQSGTRPRRSRMLLVLLKTAWASRAISSILGKVFKWPLSSLLSFSVFLSYISISVSFFLMRQQKQQLPCAFSSFSLLTFSLLSYSLREVGFFEDIFARHELFNSSSKMWFEAFPTTSKSPFLLSWGKTVKSKSSNST